MVLRVRLIRVEAQQPALGATVAVARLVVGETVLVITGSPAPGPATQASRPVGLFGLHSSRIAPGVIARIGQRRLSALVVPTSPQAFSIIGPSCDRSDVSSTTATAVISMHGRFPLSRYCGDHAPGRCRPP